MKHLHTDDGREFLIDSQNPLVLLNGIDIDGEKYGRGSLVYPAALGECENQGRQPAEGWMFVSALTDRLELAVIEDEITVPLRELLQVSGEPFGISYEKCGFRKDGKKVEDRSAIDDAVLDHYLTMQLPEQVRKSGELSRLVSSEPVSLESGIIFDSLDEIAHALRVYDGSPVRADENRFYQDVWASDNPDANVDDPALFRQTPSSLFAQKNLESINKGRGSLVDKIIEDIYSSGGRYKEFFGYEAMATSFFKTCVRVDKAEGKYLLAVYTSERGDKPEEDLAGIFGKQRALLSVGSTYELAPIAQDLVGVDVDKALRGGALTKGQIAELFHRSYTAEIDGTPVNISLGIRQEQNHMPHIIRIGGNNRLFMRTEGECKPYFEVTIRPVEKDQLVIPEEKAGIIRIRDGLNDLVQKNLS